MPGEAVFIPQEEAFVATELARGPWDPGAQHGGAPAALLMRAFERLPAAEGLQIARVTYELLRPVPLGRLEADADVIRGGRRVQLLEGSIRTPDGIEVVRARALQVQRADPSAPTTAAVPPPPGPDQGREHEGGEGFNPPYRPMFAPDAIEIRFVDGVFGRGPSMAWFRLRVPLVAGEEPSPLERLGAAGDFGNGISAELSWDEFAFINPDLTLYLERPPEGEWIGLQARTTIAERGVGLAESVIFDLGGRVGRAVQALLVMPR
ncbi:MAG TPA: thioesterase family protein [Solirubrobacteraceae bacterium]|nr:thioesterase family protein [Solirubrobacteraceae bacterium]